jgi:DUF3040 family protein
MEEALMPLSEHDQQVLAQIERGLRSDDAKLVRTLGSTNAMSYARRRLLRCGFVFALGLATLVVAVMTGSAAPSIVLGLSAFVIMLLAALRGSAILRGLLEGQRSARRPRPGKPSAVTFRLLARRAYQRWQRWQHHLDH